jgi:hypothetical protein
MFICLGGFLDLLRMVTAHFPAPLLRPAGEFQQALSFTPKQAEECAGALRRRFFAEECLHAPTDVRASPGPQPEALRRNPIKSECAKHVSVTMIPRESGETNGSSLLLGKFSGKLLKELRDNFLGRGFNHSLAHRGYHPTDLRLPFVA